MLFTEAYAKLVSGEASSIKRAGWRYNSLRLKAGVPTYYRGDAVSTREGSDALKLENMAATDWEVPSRQPVTRTMTGYLPREDALSGEIEDVINNLSDVRDEDDDVKVTITFTA